MKPFSTLESLVLLILVAGAAGAADTQPANSDAQSTTNAPATPLPAVTVRAEREDPKAYAAPEATTATKMDTPIRDVPQSIEVRTRQLLNDLGGQNRVDTIAKTVAGVTVPGNGGNGGSNIPFLTLRGFPNYGRALRDGYLRDGGYYNVMDLAAVERVEFLKGPSSVLYGSTYSLGGMVNYISKKPEAAPRLDADFTAGSYDFYRGTIDAGGSITQDHALLGRINGAYEDGKTFRDFAYHRTGYVAPSVSYQISEKDKVTVLLDYLHMEGRGDFGLPVTPRFAEVPVTKYFQEPTFDSQHFQGGSINTGFVHDFSEDWHLRIGYAYNQSYWRQPYTYIYMDDTDPLLVHRDPNNETIYTEEHDGEVSLGGKFETWKLSHELLLGLSVRSEVFTSTGNYGTLPSFGLFDPPTYGAPASGFVPTSIGDSYETVVAPYVQDLITLIPEVKVMVGARYDYLPQRSYWDDGVGTIHDDRQTDTHISPRAGIVYQPWKPTSLYFGYATSFVPNMGKNKTGEVFKPELGEMFEVGIKQEFGSHLNANLSVYQLTKQNALTPDPTDPTFSITTGEQRSRGVELDINGRISEAFRVTAAYARSLAEITKDESYPIGTRLVGAPTHSFNLFGVYSFGGPVNGLELGGGFYYASPMEAQMPNTFRLPVVAEFNALVAYRINSHFRVQLNAENLADRQNYTSDGGFIAPGKPRTFSLTASYKF